jgi:hypothetical protein
MCGNGTGHEEKAAAESLRDMLHVSSGRASMRREKTPVARGRARLQVMGTGGYPMDLHPYQRYPGMLYEERGRGIACLRG